MHGLTLSLIWLRIDRYLRNLISLCRFFSPGFFEQYLCREGEEKGETRCSCSRLFDNVTLCIKKTQLIILSPAVLMLKGH